MRRAIPLVLVLALFLPPGCGVVMNATYSQLVDKTCALGDDNLARWPTLDGNQQRQAFVGINTAFHNLRDARDGKVAP